MLEGRTYRQSQQVVGTSPIKVLLPRLLARYRLRPPLRLRRYCVGRISLLENGNLANAMSIFAFPSVSVLRAVCILLILCCVSTQAFAACRGSKRYLVKMKVDWSTESDAGYPGMDATVSPGFLGMTCVAHNDKHTMWELGKKLLHPYDKYIDYKRKDEEFNMSEAIREYIDENGNISDFIVIDDFVFPIDQVNQTVLLNGDDDATLISCMSYISPSPGWFLGIYNRDLCNATTNEWLSYTVQLFANDAGFFTGSTYTDEAKGRSPKFPVQRMRLFAPTGYGEISIDVYDKNSSSTPPDESTARKGSRFWLW